MERDEMNRMLAWLDLRSDVVFNKIPADRYRYYLESALAAGEHEAIPLLGQNIRQLCNDNQIEICLEQGDGLFFSVQFRAKFEYSQKKSIRRVTLYEPSLKSLQISCARAGLDFSLNKIIDIHLAHEFFHFLEYSRQQPVGSQLEKICNFSLGPIRSYSTVSATSEIAAHRFCQLLNDLEHYPTYYDFLWLEHSGKHTKPQNDRLFAESLQALRKIHQT